MTTDELLTQLATVAPHWDRDSWATFLMLPPDDQAIEVAIYQASSRPAAVSAWQSAIEVLTIAITAVGDITGIIGAISAIRAIL